MNPAPRHRSPHRETPTVNPPRQVASTPPVPAEADPVPPGHIALTASLCSAFRESPQARPGRSLGSSLTTEDEKQ